MRRLDRYIEASTLKSLVLVVSGLTALFSLLEFVDQLRDVGGIGDGKFAKLKDLVTV